MHTAAVTNHSALIGSLRDSAMPATAPAPTSARATPRILPRMRPPLSSAQQLAQRLRVARLEALPGVVPPGADDLYPRTPHAVHCGAPGAEDPAIEQLIGPGGNRL